MIWTERYQDGNRIARLGEDPERVKCMRWYGVPPRWLFPLMRRDHLLAIMQARYPRFLQPPGLSDFPVWEEVMFNLPVFESRGWGHQYDYFDLRIVARFAPRAFVPSMWRCAGCGNKVRRGSWIGLRDLDRRWQRISRECSEGCALEVMKNEVRRYWAAKKRREREWQRIKLCKSLLKETRQLLRQPPEVWPSPGAASKPAPTSPTS